MPDTALGTGNAVLNKTVPDPKALSVGGRQTTNRRSTATNTFGVLLKGQEGLKYGVGSGCNGGERWKDQTTSEAREDQTSQINIQVDSR